MAGSLHVMHTYTYVHDLSSLNTHAHIPNYDLAATKGVREAHFHGEETAGKDIPFEH